MLRRRSSLCLVRVFVGTLFTLIAVVLILPQLGGTRQTKEILSQTAFLVLLTSSERGVWSSELIQTVPIAESAGLLEELSETLPTGDWIVQVDEMATHWLGFTPGQKRLGVSWRPVWTVPTGATGPAGSFESSGMPRGALDALCQVVETEVIPARSFPMAERIEDGDIVASDPMAWGAGKELSFAATKWVFLFGGLALLAAAGLGVAALIVPCPDARRTGDAAA